MRTWCARLRNNGLVNRPQQLFGNAPSTPRPTSHNLLHTSPSPRLYFLYSPSPSPRNLLPQHLCWSRHLTVSATSPLCQPRRGKLPSCCFFLNFAAYCRVLFLNTNLHFAAAQDVVASPELTGIPSCCRTDSSRRHPTAGPATSLPYSRLALGLCLIVVSCLID